jgi:hypothetical protein
MVEFKRQIRHGGKDNNNPCCCASFNRSTRAVWRLRFAVKHETFALRRYAAEPRAT